MYCIHGFPLQTNFQVDLYKNREPLSENCQFALANTSSDSDPIDAACIWARESASTAVVLALMNNEENEEKWTANNTLQRYQKVISYTKNK